jgi:uncharacterized membrane protein
MKSKFFITTLAVIGLIAAILGLILSFLPMGTIDLVPAVIGLFFGLIAFFLAKSANTRKKLAISVLIIAGLAIIISLGTELFFENKVAEDTTFEQKVEESADEAASDLDDAFGDEELEITEE